MNFGFLLLFLTVLTPAYSQLFTFRDGKIGVNFLGYHAEAGLGGLLTGNAAHGGLSASAGTPFGQRAGAGLGGTIDEQGRPRGGGYAAATAGNGVGASAALGGAVDELGGSGGLGSEAHGLGYSAKKLEISSFPQQPRIPENVKSVDIQTLPAVQQRSSFAESSASASNNFASPSAVGRRQIKNKYIERRRNKDKDQELDTRIDDEEALPPQQNQSVQNLDYRNFFDFGFFSDLAASIANAPHPSSQSGNSITVRKQKTPNTVELQKFIIPNSPQVDASRKTDEFF